jgi:type I restriction enzyme M protein
MNRSVNHPKGSPRETAPDGTPGILAGDKLEQRRAEVNQAIKNACDLLNSDGVEPRNYVEQLAWMFFPKAFDEAEAARAEVAVFEGERAPERIAGKYRWSSWSRMIDRQTRCSSL